MTDEFLMEEVPALLRKLNEDREPLWGSMNALQMVDHVYNAFVLSQNTTKWATRAPEEKLDAAKQFLHSEKPLPRNVPLPEGFIKAPVHSSANLKEASERLLNEIPSFLKAIDQPNYVAYHPDFGEMNSKDILVLMRKHTRHHFAQFGLIER